MSQAHSSCWGWGAALLKGAGDPGDGSFVPGEELREHLVTVFQHLEAEGKRIEYFSSQGPTWRRQIATGTSSRGKGFMSI